MRALQRDMLEALFDRSPERAARHVHGHGLPPQRRLDIYHHNLFESLTEALAAVYPTIDALVGRGFFRFLAHQYILAHPSRSGNLHEFGGELPAFIESFEPAASLPYLPDSARLDWAWHAVFHTQAIAGLDTGDTLARIAAMPDEARPRLRLGWQPAARLVASPYPVLRIWQLHQRGLADVDAPLVDLDAGGECVLIVQRRGEVMLERMGHAEHALLDELARGATLGDAVAAALARDAQFDVAAAIAHHLALGTLVEWRLPAQ